MEWSAIQIVAVVSLAAGAVCALWILIDEFIHPQHMWIMNVVWPITGLYASFIALWAYYRYGRKSTRQAMAETNLERKSPGDERPPAATYALASTHCGGGCTLGDLVAEWTIYLAPGVLAWFGYRTLFEHKIFAAWVLDFILAFAIGIAFQFFTIAPMRQLSPAQGLAAAIKADTLSLTAWQLGMYGWMAIATFGIFGRELSQTDPMFWFMMQIAMLCGFATSYPANVLLVKRGIKESV